MTKPTLSQIVELSKEHKFPVMYVVEGDEVRRVRTEYVLEQYPDVEIRYLTFDLASAYKESHSGTFYTTYKVFI